MKKQAVSLPTNTLILVIIAIIVLVITVVFFTMITGQEIFPAIMENIKRALGMLNESRMP